MLRYYLCLMALSFNVMFGVTSVPGTLDTSFGRSGNPPGTVTTQIGIYNSVATDVKIQADQKIVVAGYQEIDAIGNREFTLARYTTTGSLDSTFGIGGVVRTRIGDDSVINAIAIQTDGKIVAAGFALENGIYKFALARYTNGGTLDEAFGINGIRTTLIGAISESNWVIIQSDGKIVAAGVADEVAFISLLLRAIIQMELWMLQILARREILRAR